jgi:hypothetical protein
VLLRKLTRNQEVVLSTLLLALTLLITALVGETALRFIHWYRDGIPMVVDERRTRANPGPITLDDTLGWRATENYRFDGFQKDAGGARYPVHIAQNEYGFRMFGHVRSKRPKILVMGDSFTHAANVSDDKTYYAYIRDSLSVEVFTYGGSGYGTLQEFLVLDRYLDLIEPDLILWQYCSNDFINNSAELEIESKWNNNGLVRPYWVSGQIVYVLPKKYSERIRSFALEYSRLLYFIFSRVDRALAHLPLESIETQIEAEGAGHPGFARSVLVTDDLMSKVRARAGQIPVVAFAVNFGDGHAVYTEAFSQVSSHYGILFFGDVEVAIRAAEDKGIVVRAADSAHWNETGHQIVGEVLAHYLNQLCIVDACGHLPHKNRSNM